MNVELWIVWDCVVCVKSCFFCCRAIALRPLAVSALSDASLSHPFFGRVVVRGFGLFWGEFGMWGVNSVNGVKWEISGLEGSIC